MYRWNQSEYILAGVSNPYGRCQFRFGVAGPAFGWPNRFPDRSLKARNTTTTSAAPDDTAAAACSINADEHQCEFVVGVLRHGDQAVNVSGL
jgi:hypothetical protein